MLRQNELDYFRLLANHKLAPQIYANFKNGFVVGHLEGRNLSADEVREPEIIKWVFL